MTRIVRRPIEIESWRNDRPYEFRDRDQIYRVNKVIDDWREMGNWWDGEGERTLLRVWTDSSAVLDLECLNQKWWLYRVWD